MKTNLRRSISAAVILTPAALLAACSTSDSWHSRADTDSGSSGRSRSDGYYSSDGRSYRTSDGRTVYYDRRATGSDPYGDGVSGGVGTRVATLNDGRTYDTRTNEMNNPNWRDGPSRFDNDNPSQDNSSSQYNTGISRNQSPADGTVNNQNLARGTVRPEGQDGRWQNQQNMQNDPNWQARNQSGQYNNGQYNSQYNNGQYGNQQYPVRNDSSWQNGNQSNNQQQYQNDPNWQSRNQAARNESDASTNPANSNAQQGQQNWQNNQQNWQANQQNQNWRNTDPNNPNWNQNNGQNYNGQNNYGQYNNGQYSQNNGQNWNQNNQPVRDQNGNWIERNLNTTNMTTPDQQAAARQMSDPATNPTNSNSQYNTAPDGTNYANRNYPVQNNSGQASSRSTAEPLGPQNNWGANRSSSTQNDRNYNNTNNNDPARTTQNTNQQNDNWIDRNLNTTNRTTPDQQAAARAIADPATNPTNSNAQVGQQNLAGVSQPGTVAPSNQPYSTRSNEMNAAGQTQVYASNASADSRILSLLHLKNQEEIELGQLAASKGSSAAVKDYGSMLVREHTAADAKVMSVASQTGTALMSESETKNMMKAEKAAMKDHADSMNKDTNNDTAKDRNKEKMADDSKVMKQPIEELRGLNGADFDRVFAQKMAKGHEKLAAAIEKAKPEVRNEQTRQLLNELLPTVQMHERMARQLPSYTETARSR